MDVPRVFVVGGTGFLGYHVVGELLRKGRGVSVLARRPAAVPEGVALHKGDVRSLSTEEWAALLAGHDGVIFGAGADDRTVPVRPAAAFFTESNVDPVVRAFTAARQVGCRSAVILGSYFTAMHRQRPDLRLPDRHPYIASRVAQAAAARRAGGPELPVGVLEIPFVFGAAPAHRPLWAPAVPWLRSRAPLVAPRGGTAVVTAAAVGEAAVVALDRAEDVDYPVVEENLTWAALLERFAVAAGRREPVRVRRLPVPVLRAVLPMAGIGYWLRRREAGLHASGLAALLTASLYLDQAQCRTQLQLTTGGVDQALRETVEASLASTTTGTGGGRPRGTEPT